MSEQISDWTELLLKSRPNSLAEKAKAPVLIVKQNRPEVTAKAVTGVVTEMDDPRHPGGRITVTSLRFINGTVPFSLLNVPVEDLREGQINLGWFVSGTAKFVGLAGSEDNP
ncbi:hypothetical protein M1403_00785 [Patescibacteria group bacterium]|nr:hypothetical protein [Patescibacteria group bacterium]